LRVLQKKDAEQFKQAIIGVAKDSSGDYTLDREIALD